jgi:hypothetical protein
VFISGKYLNYFLRHEGNITSKAGALGYDFLEGNSIFHFINTNIGLNEHEKRKALETRLGLYFYFRNSFINEEVESSVYESMLKLDPAMKEMIKYRRLKEIRVAIIETLKSKFRFLVHRKYCLL